MFALMSLIASRPERKGSRRKAYRAMVESLEGRYLLNGDHAVAAQVQLVPPLVAHTAVGPAPLAPVRIAPPSPVTNRGAEPKVLQVMMFSNTGSSVSNDQFSGLSSSPDDDVREKMEEALPFENGDGAERTEDGLLNGDDVLLDTNSDDIDLTTPVAPPAPPLPLLDSEGVDHLLENETTSFPTFEGGPMTTSSRVHVICDPYFDTLEVAQR